MKTKVAVIRKSKVSKFAVIMLPLKDHRPSTNSKFTVGQGKMCSVSGAI